MHPVHSAPCRHDDRRPVTDPDDEFENALDAAAAEDACQESGMVSHHELMAELDIEGEK